MARRFLPPQHGAWAMLAVPFLAGLLVAGPAWPAFPLAGAWVAGYLFSYYLFQSVKTRRPRRFQPQLVVYGALTGPLLALVVWAVPDTLWYAPAFVAAWAGNAWYAWWRRERALVNDLAAVAQTGLVVLVLGTVAGVGPMAVAGPAVACVAYFAGTALYVKTMIRRRDDLVYRRWSVAYHAALVGFAALLTPRYGVAPLLFVGWLLGRAWALPGRGLRPMPVGLVEIGNSVLLLGVVWLTWG